MVHRAFPIVGLTLAIGILGPESPAVANDTPEKPNAPKQIDPTPPLVPIPNAKVTPDGLLIGGQPSPEQLKAIQEAGYHTVVTLRPDSERGDEGEQAAVEAMGMKFVSIPVAGAPGLTEENAPTTA